MQKHHNNISWRKYIDKTATNKVRPLLVEALSHVKEKGSALDLGSGALNESKHLLAAGFNKVTAVDADEAAEERARGIDAPGFSFIRSTYGDFDFPKETYDLVNAQYALPFNESETFDTLMTKIKESLKPGGIFAFNLFGNKDDWNVPGAKKTFHTLESAKAALAGLSIIKFEEKESDEGTALGKPKHWHLFDIIASR